MAHLADDVLFWDTRTSVKVMPRVSLQRWPRLISFLPTSTPSQARSTRKAVMPR